MHSKEEDCHERFFVSEDKNLSHVIIKNNKLLKSTVVIAIITSILVGVTTLFFQVELNILPVFVHLTSNNKAHGLFNYNYSTNSV